MIGKIISYALLEKQKMASPESIRKLQLRKIKEITSYAYHNVPFYTKKFDIAGMRPEDINSFKDLEKIPLTTKEELKKAGDCIISKEHTKEELYTSRTSGSQGLPFTSYFDKNAWNTLKYASKLRARSACGQRLGARIVNIETYDKNQVEELNHTAKNSFFNIKYLSIFDDIENHITFLESFKPDVLYGLASYFLELGRIMMEMNLHWNENTLIFTSGEMLDVSTKKKLRMYFGNNVFDVYGSTELKEVAWECKEHKGYHINDDLYYVEFVEKKGCEDFELVITSFVNKAMPLIRFSLGDHGRKLEEKCKCGLAFSMLTPMQGRDVDYFLLPDDRLVSPYMLTMSVEPIKSIFQYKIIQHSKEFVEFMVVLEKTGNEAISRTFEETIDEVKMKLGSVLGKDVCIQVTLCSRIPLGNNGKYRIVESMVKRK